MSAIVLGHDDQAAGVLVEPMHDAGPQFAAGGGERLEAVQQRVDQRAAAARIVGCWPEPGMHHHAGRLVDHGEVRIFEDHAQRNVFSHGLERRRMRLAGNGDGFAAAQFVRSLGARAVHEHIALLQQKLHARPADAIELAWRGTDRAAGRRLRRDRQAACSFMRVLASSLRIPGPVPQLATCSCRRSTASCAPFAAAVPPASTSTMAATCGPSSAPRSTCPRPSGSRQNSVM